MKLFNYTSLSGAVVVFAMIPHLTSCSDYELVDQSGMQQLEKIDEYNQNFVNRYGTPDPNHDFGMSTELVPIVRLSGADTRAGGAADGATSDNVDVRRNMWVLGFVENPKGSFRDEAGVIGHDIKIPGWPNDDGYYYTSSGAGALQYVKTFDELTNSDQPVGDVTAYEIQYVSTWFRTHKNIQSHELHLSDFFIQNVSVDHDQLEYTGAIDCGNQVVDLDSRFNSLPEGVVVGPNGTNIQYAKDASNEDGSKKTPYTITRKQPNSNEQINYSLDYLHFKAIGASEEVGTGWTHVNNFNNNNANYDPENSASNPQREIKYVTSSGTESFACRASMSVAEYHPWVKDYVLVHLSWKETMADGQEHIRSGYYLGFDYSMEKGETKVEADGFYSNWIVKITPGHFSETTTKAARVMCEDLGSTYDFDFNDVVYDVALVTTGGTTDAVINLQAAGGTLPLWVGTDDISGNPTYEAHKMLGESTSDNPVNVLPNSGTHANAIYRIKNVDSKFNLHDIKIFVKQNGAIKEVSGENGNLGDDGNMSAVEYGEQYKGTNAAPRRFAVPVGTRWMQECQFIEKGYDKFAAWVQDKNATFDISGGRGPWYQHIHGPSLLYTSSVSATSGGGSSTIDEWIEIIPWSGMNSVAGGHDGGLQIYGYGEYTEQAIWYQLDNGKNSLTLTVVYKVPAAVHNAQQAYVASPDTKTPRIAARILPVLMKNEGTSEAPSMWPYYAGSEVTEPFRITHDMANMNHVPAVFQEAYPIETEGAYAGMYTYTNRFTFSKEQMMVNDNGTQRLCDYLLLYIQNPTDVNLQYWYAHY